MLLYANASVSMRKALFSDFARYVAYARVVK